MASSAVAQFGRKYEPYVIAGPSREGDFPPGLNTSFPPWQLRSDETPDGYGFDLTEDGFIVKGTIPTGTARIQQQVVIGSQTNYWHYQRLWSINDTNLLYYAPYYKDALVKQRLGKWVFGEDANPILAIVPVEPDLMTVFKASGMFVLGNCADTRALFQRTDIVQEMYIQSADRAIELEGFAFASNDKGLYGYSRGQVVEATRPIRNSLQGLTNLSLTADYQNKWVIGGTNLVYSLEAQKVYRFLGTQFRFTTREFVLPDWKPFHVDRFYVVIKHSDEDNGYLKYQQKFDGLEWSREFTMPLKYQSPDYTIIPETIDPPVDCTRFQLRITDMSSNIQLKQIRLSAQAFSLDDYKE